MTNHTVEIHTATRGRRATRASIGRAFVAAVLLTAAACGGPADPTYVPLDPSLWTLPLYFYPAAGGPGSARGFVFFFGNDIGFWGPHRKLALAMSEQRYDVVGFDMKPLLASLPDSGRARDSAFVARVGSTIAASRRELGADSLPAVVAGHSIGAEVAIWTAAHVPVPRLAGVLALSPGSRSHLRVTAADIATGPEPTDAESFSVAREVAALPPGVRLALVRGEHDKYQFADSAIVEAGGSRAQRYVVRFAGHTLKRIIVARPVVRRALEWMLESRAAPPS